MKTSVVRYSMNRTMIQAKWETGVQLPVSPRGVITGFSRQARKRLFDWIHTIDLERAGRALFFSATYGQAFPDGKTSKKHLDTFFKRLVRAYPSVSALWRMEYQERGAIHYHMILWGASFIPKEDLQEMWAEVVGVKFWDHKTDTPRYPFTRVEAIRSTRGVLWYVGKYIGKIDDVGTPDTKAAAGGVKSEIGEAGGTEAPRAPSGFNSSAYLTGGYRDGRFWGVVNRRALPRDLMQRVLSMPCGEMTDAVAAFVGIDRFGKNSQYHKGSWTVYLNEGESAGEVLQRMLDTGLIINESGMFKHVKANAC